MKVLFEKNGMKITDDDLKNDMYLPCAVVNLFERDSGWYRGALSVQFVPKLCENDDSKIELTIQAADYESTKENYPQLVGTSIVKTVPTEEFCSALMNVVELKQREPYWRYLLPFIREYLLTFVQERYKFWHRELNNEITLEELYEEVKDVDNEPLFQYMLETYG